ncbi:hypothetical protein GCM10022626_02150 [[Pseudomonas] carboxydohydrogena]
MGLGACTMISGNTVPLEAAGAGAGVAAGGVACCAWTDGVNTASAIAEALASEARREERDIVNLILTPRAAQDEQPRIERRAGHGSEWPGRTVQVRERGGPRE